MITRQTATAIRRCAAAMLASCLLVAGCASATPGSRPASPPAQQAPAASPTTPLRMGGSVRQAPVTGTQTYVGTIPGTVPSSRS